MQKRNKMLPAIKTVKIVFETSFIDNNHRYGSYRALSK